jgi:hypothetical protein|tara:strand:- start:829 stop:1092 length:264 start_codon:yes stop_codon:yes gene_type:complete
LARIEFSDVEYLLSKIGKGKIDSRIESILYESAISKVASIFQLAIRAYKYLEKPELKEDLIIHLVFLKIISHREFILFLLKLMDSFI